MMKRHFFCVGYFNYLFKIYRETAIFASPKSPIRLRLDLAL